MLKRSYWLALFVCCMVLVNIGVAQASLTDGLVAYYPFNGNANDESGNGNSGSVYGATLTTDRFGNANKAYVFNGTTDYIGIANGPSFIMSSAITLTAWVKYQAEGTIITHGGQCPDGASPFKGYQFILRATKTGNIDMTAIGGSGNFTDPMNQITSDNIIFNDGYYHLVVVTFNSGNMAVYIDGKKDTAKTIYYDSGSGYRQTVPSTLFTTLAVSTDVVTVGTGYAYCDYVFHMEEFFKGSLDDIRIYNRALSDTDVQQLYNEGSTYTLTYTKSGTGSGTVSDGADTWNAAATKTYNAGSSVTLTATANSGSTFAGWSGDCTGSSSTCTVTMSAAKNVTATFNQSCSYTIAPTSKGFPSSGGNDSISVTANTGCTWTASSSVAWITINAGSSGSGNGSVSYTVAANTATTQRTGTMMIAGQTFTVTQDGITCTYTLTPTSKNFQSSGGTDSVSVTANTGCTWMASSNANWITINAGNSGSGNGSVSYTVAANTATTQRTGSMTIAGQTFTVTQDGITCSYSITPTSKNFSSTGGTDSVGVTANTGCAWTASSSASWITITSGSSGSSNGTVSYNVAANTATTQRTGTMTIAGQTFTVTQDAAVSCTFALSPTSKQFQSSGGSGSVNITTTSDCNWTAVSNANWITITSNTSGSGNATVNYSVAENTSAARTGTMTIGGQTFTVTQSGPDCSTGMSIN
ncbi:conserved hypothetical protein, secreted, partial [Candidatus Magnetobacterium bavaricum]